MLRIVRYLFLFSPVFLGIFSCSKTTALNDVEKEWLRQNDSIKVAVYPYYIPYQFINRHDKIDGVFIEYLEHLEKKIDYKFQKKYYTDWSSLVEGAKKGEVDIILEIQETKEKKKYLNFFPPLFESNHVIVTRKDANFGTSIKTLYNKKVTLPANYAITETIQSEYPKLQVFTDSDDIICLQKLNNGEYDAYIGPRAVINYIIRNQKLTNLTIQTETKLTYEPALAVNKKNKILTDIVSKAISGITQSEKKSILNNWFYNSIVPFYQTPVFWISFSLITLLLLIVIAAFNSYLKFKIKQRTEELLIAKEIAEESTTLKTNFINNIPYEIRTPMNGIAGLSKFLDTDDLSVAKRKKYTQMIIGNSKVLISMIDNILEVSKLQTKRSIIRLSEVNLDDLFITINSNYEIKSEEKNIAFFIKNNLSDDQNLILIDKPKLKKVLYALIDNAIKFTEKGSITVSCALQNRKILISIKDTGIGMNDFRQKTILESLAKPENKSLKNLNGLGFGLTIAKKNIDAIGGKMTFISNENIGTTFTITVPYNQVIRTTENPNIDTSEGYRIPKTEKHVILIAEDKEINFLFLKTILTKMPEFEFLIYRAKNGKEAITICQENENIDLVLMDIKMPVMDGYDATRYIKKIRPNLPVIAQTAYSVEEDIQKAIVAGCDDFVSKPVDRKILKPLIKKYFSNFKRTQKIKQ